MKHPNEMTAKELQELIEIFPTNSVCDRRKLEKLKELLLLKQIEERQNGPI